MCNNYTKPQYTIAHTVYRYTLPQFLIPSIWKKSQNESGLEMGSGFSGMGCCDGLYVDTPLGTREKKFSKVSSVPVSLERTIESVMHCSSGLSQASSYCVCSQLNNAQATAKQHVDVPDKIIDRLTSSSLESDSSTVQLLGSATGVVLSMFCGS